jgi:hypothetical protein
MTYQKMKNLDTGLRFFSKLMGDILQVKFEDL